MAPQWPCLDEPYQNTIRARLYGEPRRAWLCALLAPVAAAVLWSAPLGPLLSLVVLWLAAAELGRELGPARRAVRLCEEWRAQWHAAVAASPTMSAAAPDDAEAAFAALPEAPMVMTPREGAWRREWSVVPPRHASAPWWAGPTSMHQYGTLGPVVARIAWCCAARGGTVLRKASGDALVVWRCHTHANYFAHLRARAPQGAAPVLELEDGVLFWIPEGARLAGDLEVGFGGELKHFRVRPAIKEFFWRGFLRGFLIGAGKDEVLRHASTTQRNVLTTAEFASRGFDPWGGDSLDLVVLYAARPWRAELGAVVTEDGESVFRGVEEDVQALRVALLSDIDAVLAEPPTTP